MSLLLTLLENTTGEVNVSKFYKEFLNRSRLPHVRETVHQLKTELIALVGRGLVSVKDNAHLQLDTIHGNQPISPNGLALPIKYHDLDDVAVHATYIGPKVEETPVQVVETPAIPVAAVEAPAPVLGQVDQPKVEEVQEEKVDETEVEKTPVAFGLPITDAPKNVVEEKAPEVAEVV